jgi:glucose-6-phosphate isomerase
VIKIDFESYNNYHAINDYFLRASKAYDLLINDPEMTDWLKLDKLSDEKILQEIDSISQSLLTKSDILLVLGIGGSYLGSKSVLSALDKDKVIYAGYSLDKRINQEVWSKIQKKDIAVCVVSKSGDTLEIKEAYQFFINKLKPKYPKDLNKRIVVITNNKEGYLYKEANQNNYKVLNMPDNIGGRYSFFTVANLFPLAYAGLRIRLLFKGAKEVNVQDAIKYAALREYYYRSGKFIENFVAYDEHLLYFNEWLKQLFAETQGKNQKGILPISTLYTRDLHSLGQYIQEGEPIIFETVLFDSSDKLLNIAKEEVAKAHLMHNTYSTIINLDDLSLYNIGYLIYFFELSAAIGGYMLGVNPFDQPGVEEYKKGINSRI